MTNPISTWLERRKQKKAQRAHLQQLNDLTRIYSTFEKLERGNLLHFDVKNRRLYIEQPLAMLMMKNADTWMNFLHSIHDWQYLREVSHAWNKYMQQEEIAAVREAMKKYSVVTPADRDRIRRDRRNAIAISDVEPPVVADYEYFILRDSAEPAEPSSQAILAVGHYSASTGFTEIASWQDVAQFLK